MPIPARPTVRCAVLTSFGWDFPTLYSLAAPGVDFLTFDNHCLGLPESPNPFGLEIADYADVILMSSYWYGWLSTHHPTLVDATFQRLERLGSAIVGFDTADQFSLELPPEAFDRFSLILKAHGVYRDRDLYNYQVGTLVPGGNWTAKKALRRERYSSSALEKLRLGLPCFVRDIPAVRRHCRSREFGLLAALHGERRRGQILMRNTADLVARTAITRAPIRRRPLEAHCMGSLTHIQRLDALKALAGLSGIQGISQVPPHVRGTNPEWNLPPGEHEEIVSAAAPFMRPPVGRMRFVRDVARHKVVVAPTGYGELTFRHGEALRAGSVLVCQALDHVEMRFPFRDDHNVVYCRPDLSDLRDRVDELIADEARRIRLATTGQQEILAWDSRWSDLFDAAIAAPLREALGPRSR